MGSGLSMTSVNKIKELAEQREYSLALDIVDSQDLSKSLNPQFLRICGDVYINNNRYKDARKTLLMAHKLAPEGKRVIFSLVNLYLKMGYKDLADTYYNLYLFDADLSNPETNQIKYIFEKAQGAPFRDLYPLIYPYYIHNWDYDWSFETFLLLIIMGKNDDADILGRDYCANFKNTDNSKIIEKILSGKDKPDSYFYVYNRESLVDDDPEQEEEREEEKLLLEADELRVNPRDAEITIMVDDYEEADVGTKHRLKKFLKSESRKENSEKNQNEEAVSDEYEKEIAADSETNSGQEEDIDKKSLFRKIFSKRKKDADESDDEIADGDISETEQAESEDTETEQTKSDGTETEQTETNATETEYVEADGEKYNDTNHENMGELLNQDSGEEKGVHMHELHTNKHTPVVSVDFDNDDFTAEADTVDGLKDEDFSNPFDSISAIKKEKEEPIFVPKRNADFLFDDVELEFNDDEDEFEVDDFSSTDDEFGRMDNDTYQAENENSIENIEPEEESSYEEPSYEEPDEGIEEESIEEESSYEEPSYEEPEEEIEEESIEEESSYEEPSYEEPDEGIEEESIEEESSYEEPDEGIEEESEEESIEEESSYEEPSYEEPEEGKKQEIIDSEQGNNEKYIFREHSKLEFPVFRSSLFPNHNRKEKVIENNFNQIMNEGRDRMQENLQKEEQMQREAEALLASLGIDLGSISVSSENMDSINTTLYNEPSRDELKASLKIDSVKKNILNSLKEYR